MKENKCVCGFDSNRLDIGFILLDWLDLFTLPGREPSKFVCFSCRRRNTFPVVSVLKKENSRFVLFGLYVYQAATCAIYDRYCPFPAYPNENWSSFFIVIKSVIQIIWYNGRTYVLLCKLKWYFTVFSKKKYIK